MAAQPAPQQDNLFESYAELIGSLLPELGGLCFFDADLVARGSSLDISVAQILTRLKELAQSKGSWLQQHSQLWQCASGARVAVLPIKQGTETLLGVLCLQFSPESAKTQPADPLTAIAARIKPAMDCMRRELSVPQVQQAPRAKTQILTERTQELEWLFKVTTASKGESGEQQAMQQLLAAARDRLGCQLGALLVPEKRLLLQNGAETGPLRQALVGTQAHLLTWAQRNQRPLVINTAARGRSDKIVPCKILAVPLVRWTGRVMGTLAFFNPPEAPDFGSRQLFLARHLGRQMNSMLEAQFDLATGLYNRGALEQMFDSMHLAGEGEGCAVIYIDIDRIHVVNELHGFEIGDELIVRIADLLTPPLLPEGALAARLSGDRFAAVLSNCSTAAAAEIAQGLREAAAKIVIGPAQQPVEVSISCGLAGVPDVPQGLSRALAAAEVACKTAKNRGRNRSELYASDDVSMMRHRGDVIAVGQLREALKADRMLLYAQRIVPLKNRGAATGYELLIRMRGEDGSIIAPAAFISAAQRYQLLPSLDRWVMERALQMLGPCSGMLLHNRISMSINVSGQSVGDEAFITQFIDRLRTSGVAPGCITLEITEQAAVSNLQKTEHVIRQLRALGCRFALDDFGTGVNSLTYLKSLPVTRLKIDGSFVRDLLKNPRSEATVKAIVQLAQNMGLETVGEFVENAALAHTLRIMGVDYAQGYAFGKPEPLEQVLAELQRTAGSR